jgi:outer membrane protein TolC
MKECIKAILLLCTVLAYSPLLAEGTLNSENGKKKRALSYQEYLKTITGKLPDIQKNRLRIRIARSRVHTAKSVDDVEFEGRALYSVNEEERSGDVSGTFEVEDEREDYDLDYRYDATLKTYSINSAVKKTFSSTGTRLSTGVDVSFLDFKGAGDLRSRYEYSIEDFDTPRYIEGSISRKYYAPSAYIGFVQPLLFNTFGVLDRFAKNDAEMKLKIEQLKKGEYDKSVISYYRKLYFDWILYSRILKILEGSISNARKLERNIRRRYQVGLADNDDLQKARYAVNKYSEQYNKNRMAYRSVLNELRLFVDVDTFVPRNEQFDHFFEKSSQEAFTEVSFEKTRSCRILKLTLDNLKYVKSMSENRMLPQINLLGRISARSFNTSFSDAIKGLNKEMRDLYYTIGVIVSYPFGNHESEGAREDVEISIRQLNAEFRNAVNRYKKNLTNIISLIHLNREALGYKKSNIISLTSKLRTEKKKYNMARLNLSYLIDTENSIARERIEELLIKKRLITLMFDYRDLIQ